MVERLDRGQAAQVVQVRLGRGVREEIMVVLVVLAEEVKVALEVLVNMQMVEMVERD